jgi:hypothetical protein
MTSQDGSVLTPPRKDNNLSEIDDVDREVAESNALSEINLWANNAIRILKTKSPDELHRSGMKTIVDEYRSTPAPKLLDRDTSSKVMEAQAKLLHFFFTLKRYLDYGLDESKYEYSRQSFLTALSAVT